MRRSGNVGSWAIAPLFAMQLIAGCHRLSICERLGVTTGQFVRAKTSAYLAGSRQGNDRSHIACRAEAIIPVTLGFMLENESELCNHTGVCAQRNGPDTIGA